MVINQITVIRLAGWVSLMGVILLIAMKFLFKQPISGVSVAICFLISMLALLNGYVLNSANLS